MNVRVLRSLAVLSGLLGPATVASAQSSATVSGRVTDVASKAPLVGARVAVIGTSLVTATNADGRYRIAGVPAGAQTVRVYLIGYKAGSRAMSATAGGSETLDFEMSITAFSLDEFVVTATGEESKRSVGNAVSTVDVSPLVATTSVANMSDLLVGKAPGVVVLPGSITGAGGRVRIRGNSSLSLSNNPIYVVDGIRVASDVNSSSIGIGGSSPSRVNDLNPEDIETIDIVRGPSAATLYGTDAANGVIVIRTKRGRAGPTVWNAYTEQGLITDHNKYPTAYRGWRNTSTASNTTQCLLNQVVTGICAQDSVSSYNLWEDKESSPLGTGNRSQTGLQASGGTENVRFFVAGEFEKETGVYQLPAAFANRIYAGRSTTELPSELDRPNALRRVNLRANLNATLTDKMDISISSGFVTSRLRLPQTDNNAVGVGSNAFGGPGFKNYTFTPGGGPARNNLGWRASTPDEIFAFTNQQDINRSITSATFNFRPNSWLTGRAVSGLDFIARQDTELCRRDECAFLSTIRTGYKAHNRTNFFNYTGDASMAATYTLPNAIGAKSTAGVQYIKDNNTRNLSYGEDLVPGSTVVSAGSIQTAGEATITSVTLGYFFEQQLSWKDRLYLTGAVRSDRNSAFGNQFSRVYYPKVSLSYVLSDEPFFPKGVVSSLRLRSAFGASGRQPGGNDAIPFFSPSTVSYDNVDSPGLVLSALGNAALKPERSQEFEVGFDASFANSTVNLEVTAYSKSSKDALINRTIPGSVGGPAARFENIGQVRNRGLEASLNVVPVNTKTVGWDFTLSGSYNKNKIVSLGGTPPNRGTTTSDIQGYPIQAWWMRTYTFQDKNGDGLITGDTASAVRELFVTDTAVYIGPSLPVAELTFYNTFEFFGRKLRIQTLLDSKLGGYQLNGTERIRCDNRLNCRGDVDPKAPLWEQARAIAVRVHPARTQAGFAEKTNMLRFRELSLTYTLPTKLARAFGSSRATFTAAGRNLGIITGYSGIDPEGGYFGTNIGVQSDFQTQPPPTYFTFRLNVAF